jgi:dihydroneopterin aldolase
MGGYIDMLIKSNLAWVHMKDLRFFLFLGANPHEKNIGQNIKIDLSLQINYEGTEDKLENTVDYGLVFEHIKNKIENLNEINLLEYLAENLINSIGEEFKGVLGIKISIEKGYAPLKHYTGLVRFEAEKFFKSPSNN